MDKTQRNQYIIIGLLILIAIGVVLAVIPGGNKGNEQAQNIQTNATEEIKEVEFSNEEKIAIDVMQRVKNSLKDPNSFEVLRIGYNDYTNSGDISTSYHKVVIALEYTATNSFGGRIKGYARYSQGTNTLDYGNNNTGATPMEEETARKTQNLLNKYFTLFTQNQIDQMLEEI